VAEAKEIIATHEWQLLGENDTVPAGLHIKMDLSTGEKWAKIASDEERDDDIKAAAHEDNDNNDDTTSSGGGKIEQVEMDPSGALSIVETSDNDAKVEGDSTAASSDNDNDDATTITGETLRRDYEMMHRVMSQLPPEELERFGGLPALPSPNSTASSKLTDAQREIFEERMERIWQSRQEELAKLQNENVADLPSMLRDRIEMIRDHLMDVGGSLNLMVERRRAVQEAEEDDDASGGNDDDDEMMVIDVVDALRDLEYQLADVDMARDFHTLGGWPYLVALLDDDVHYASTDEDDEDLVVLVNEIRALAAMTIGTSVSNLGEFSGWALEDVSSELAAMMMDEAWVGSTRHTNDTATTTATSSSALSLLIQSFENELSLRSQQMAGGSMAVLPSATSSSDATYKSRATYKLRAVYALGSLLRGNPPAQHYFVSRDGAGILARDALGTLSNVRGPSAVGKNGALAKLDYKFASKVLALGEDIVMGVVLKEGEEKKEGDDVVGDEGGAVEGDFLTANQLVAAFTTERWCDLSLRMLVPPSDVIGATASRGIKERALTAVGVLAPGCQRLVNEENGEAVVPWGLEEVRSVRSEWNREGSDDGLDSVYRRELLHLVDGVLEVLQ